MSRIEFSMKFFFNLLKIVTFLAFYLFNQNLNVQLILINVKYLGVMRSDVREQEHTFFMSVGEFLQTMLNMDYHCGLCFVIFIVM